MGEVCKVGRKTDKSGQKGRTTINAHTILIVRSSRIEDVEYPDLQDSIDEAVLLEKLRQQAKARARTGRGGLGNPSKIIIEKKKWMDNSEFYFASSVIPFFPVPSSRVSVDLVGHLFPLPQRYHLYRV